MARYLLAASLLVTAASSPSQDTNWPGFRGPRHDGVALGATPPTEWGDEKNLRWKVELPGPGSSSPILAGDRVYVTCYSGYGNYLDDGGDKAKLVHHLACYAAADGKLLWDTPVPGPLKQAARQMQLTEHGFASPTPILAGDRIFAYFGRAGVVAFDLDGGILWRTDLGHPDPKAPTAKNQVIRKGKPLDLRWGAAASPVVHGDLVIVNCSEESNSIRALSQKTGELVWKHEAAELEGTAVTPAVFGTGDEAVLVVVLGGEIWGMDPGTGKFHWRVKTGTMGGMSSMPVSSGGLAYVFGGDDESYAVRLARKLSPASRPVEAGTPKPEQPAADPRVAWTSSSAAIPSPVLFEGRLLVVRSNGFGLCIDPKDGKVLQEAARLPGRTGGVYASPVVADGKLYVVSRKRGTFVYSADGKFKLLATNKLSDKAQCNASPAVAGKALFLRSDKFLYRFEAN